MTDRELLELAAKAAGMNTHRYCELWNAMAAYTPENGYYGHSWNPLNDDGDALRLAVKLHINVSFIWDGENDQYDPVTAWKGRVHAEEQIGITLHQEFDEDAATRRAIVRAAAEIGKAML